MVKKIISALFISLLFVSGFSFASERTVNAAGLDVTYFFAHEMADHAAQMAYYAMNDTTFPLGTGIYFAKKEQSGGE
ncbi:MAG TPA: hypothetical protein VFK44_07350 [Bacillales bacterium]|nr:hypothetical protein [Bacillales bacterium]